MGGPSGEWLSWSQAAELVGCPVSTIDWHTRTGRIETRPHLGSRPTVQRESAEKFAVWWAADQQRRAERRAARTLANDSPPDPAGWVTVDQAALTLHRSASTVMRYVRAGQLQGVRRGRRWWLEEKSVVVVAGGLSEWISFVDAAHLIGCSVKRLERAVKAGEIRQRVAQRAEPSLERASVERFGRARKRRQAEADRVAADAAAALLPPDQEHDWLNPAQAAVVLGITATRVRQLAEAERLPCVRKGRRWWFRKDHMLLNARSRELELRHSTLS